MSGGGGSHVRRLRVIRLPASSPDSLPHARQGQAVVIVWADSARNLRTPPLPEAVILGRQSHEVWDRPMRRCLIHQCARNPTLIRADHRRFDQREFVFPQDVVKSLRAFMTCPLHLTKSRVSGLVTHRSFFRHLREQARVGAIQLTLRSQVQQPASNIMQCRREDARDIVLQSSLQFLAARIT